MSDILGVTIAASLTILALSQLFKYTRFYRIAEMSQIAAYLGNLTVIAVLAIMNKGFTPQFIIPTILGLLYFSILSEKYRWLSRYPIAIMIGVGTGVTLRAVMQAQFIDQIIDTAKAFSSGNPTSILNALILTIGVISALSVFIFTDKYTEQLRLVRLIGRTFLFIAMGVLFANAMFGDYTLAYNRIKFLFEFFTGKLF